MATPPESLQRIDLSAEVALVTGASRGIGKAIAQALVAAGARVALNARSRPDLQEALSDIQETGGRVHAIAADVSEPAAVDQLVAETEVTLGPITLLVNNAGVLGPIGVLWEVDPVEWWHCVEINLRGPFLCTRAVLPGMLTRRNGAIVSLASTAATGPTPDGTAYASAKTGLVRLTESLSIELEESGVTAFAIDPGQVDTRMHEFLGSSAEWLKRRGSHNPQFTPAERTAELVVGIASGRAAPLSGLLLHATDDLDGLLRSASEIRASAQLTLRLQR